MYPKKYLSLKMRGVKDWVEDLTQLSIMYY